MTTSPQFRDARRFWAEVPRETAFFRGANISHAATHNRKIILHTIRVRGEIGRTELATITGLSPPAVFKIANDLLEQGLVIRTRSTAKTKGKPTHALSLNPDAAFAFGLNIDRGNLTLIVADFAGRVRHRFHSAHPFALPKDVRAFVADSVEQIRADQIVPIDAICGLGVAIPDDLASTHLPNQPDAYVQWEDMCLKLLLGDIVGQPIVSENDAASAAIGEMHFGAGLSLDSFFYVFISAGLGGGLVINRQYVRGAHGRSGEIGFLPSVNPLRRSRSDLQKHLGDSVLLSTLLQSGYDPDRKEVLAAQPLDLAHADNHIEEWIGGVADLLYLPLLTVLCTIDPDAILLGGQLPPDIAERLCLQLNHRLSMNVGVHWPNRAVRPAMVTDDAAAVGAAVLALQAIWDPPAF